MSAFTGIRSVSDSIVGYLKARWETEPLPGGAPGELLRNDINANIELVSSGQLGAENASFDNTLTLWLYRVSVNEQLRNSPRDGSPVPLHVDLHYLLTSWSQTADIEQRLLGWAMRTLQDAAILDASLLSPDGLWAPDEVVHLSPEELTTEDMLQLWDSLEPNYRLSYSYVARVVSMLPTDVADVDVPVVARRVTASDEEV
jgi:hypothetical protein